MTRFGNTLRPYRNLNLCCLKTNNFEFGFHLKYVFDNTAPEHMHKLNKIIEQVIVKINQ